MKHLKWLILALVIAATLFLATNTTQQDNTVSVNETMSEIGSTMENLFPMVFSDQPLSEQDTINVSQAVDKLSELFDDAKPHFALRSITYRLSFNVISEHINSIKSALNLGNTRVARTMIREFTSICTSCHTQDNQQRILFNGAHRDQFDSDFYFAEFNYMTRNYAIAEDNYKKYLASGFDVTEDKFLTALKRMLTIHLQILNDASGAATMLVQYEDNTHNTAYSRKSVEAWLQGLEEIKSYSVKNYFKPDYKEVSLFAEKILGDLNTPGTAMLADKSETVKRVWLRGLLYHYLNTSPPEDELPQILYWLSICDRSVSYSFYYSLADLYLKECITGFSDSPFASKCFDEYNEYVTFAFSGSRGTEIPEDIQQELKQLRGLVPKDE